jgi:D-alanyl-D-alanine carboxypeptidase
VQITPALTGFGHTSPTCPACAPNTVKRSYGLGVILRRDWITTTKQFAGSDATIADLPAQKIAIAVEATYRPAAFDADGNHADASLPLVTQLARILAPASPIG